jgi:hypothetical protein
MLLTIIVSTFLISGVYYCIDKCYNKDYELIYNNKKYYIIDNSDSDEETLLLNKYTILSTYSSDDDL